MTTEVVEQNGQASAVLAKMSSQIEGMDVRTLATVLVKSGYFQDTKEIAQAVVKVLAGKELGFGPIASMQGVYIVKGRASLASNLIAAAIQRSGRFRYRVTKLDATACSISFYERWDGQWQQIGESTFSMEDAKKAKLDASQTYQQFPRNMLFARALTNGARWYCPEVFNGPVYTPDELGASVDDEGRVIDIPAAPPMDTATVAANAREYDRIHGPNGDGEHVQTPHGRTSRRTGEVVDEAQPPTRSEKWQENRRLAAECQRRGLAGVPILNVNSGEDAIDAANADLRARLEAHAQEHGDGPPPMFEDDAL